MTARRPLAVLAMLSGVLVAVPSTSNADGGSVPAARAFAVTAAFNSDTVLRNERAVLRGTVEPVRTSTRVIIQRRTDDGWRKMARRTLTEDGSYRFALMVNTAGTYDYRAKMPAVGSIEAGVSPVTQLTVAEEALVVFRIPAGTGAGDWNTPATAVDMTVGDTLRLVNQDSMAHQLHTDGAPFPHQTESVAPGVSVDLVTTDPFKGWLYCHVHGTTSQFWVDVVE